MNIIKPHLIAKCVNTSIASVKEAKRGDSEAQKQDEVPRPRGLSCVLVLGVVLISNPKSV